MTQVTLHNSAKPAHVLDGHRFIQSIGVPHSALALGVTVGSSPTSESTISPGINRTIAKMMMDMPMKWESRVRRGAECIYPLRGGVKTQERKQSEREQVPSGSETGLGVLSQVVGSQTLLTVFVERLAPEWRLINRARLCADRG